MTLDISTLLVVTVYVEAMLGLLLLFAWAQNTTIHGVAWWGFGHLLRAASVSLFGMYGSAPDLMSIDLANALLFTSFAATWTGARLFDGRPAEPVYLVAGAVLWLLICRLPSLSDSVELRVLFTSGIVTAYTWLTAFEFWRGRGEPLVSRWPAIFLLFAHGALYLLRTPLIKILPWPREEGVAGSVWLTVLSFEALLLTISIAFVLLAMAKERIGLHHKTAAMIDPLTGLANRRSFFEEAALAGREGSALKPVTVLAMDLDHFKSINDRFGHALGDRVLGMFADVLRQCVRTSDLTGRLGGEEFVALLYDISPQRAVAVAERIRAAFAEVALDIDDHPVSATVSIGVVHSRGGTVDLAELVEQADAALYLAKEAGRNRVEVAALEAFVMPRESRARDAGHARMATASAPPTA